ncbi:MAG: T9SS type A sorting domain-containing protein, partial [Ignavibacteriales bacterium]|nr:T9SS type A sorting domain-containing protein [Ignavibacteriales bacterium]
SGGNVFYAKNIGTKSTPSFQLNTEYFSTIKLNGNASTVSLADWDNDGDYDLLSGIWTSNFIYYRNIGNNSISKFQQATTTFTSLNPGSSYTSPVFVNLDNDGDWDIVSGLLNGTLVYYVNNGSSFSQNTTLFAGIDVGWTSIPTFADIDGDGDLDLLIGAESASEVSFYKNNSGSFVKNDTLLQGIIFPNYCRPTFVDIDNDNDYDLVIGKINGSILFYENIGNVNQPVWQQNDVIFANIKVDQNAHTGFADMDNDGRKDMLIGEYNGNFTYYKNLFSPVSIENENLELPSNFVLYQNFPNPFNPSTKIRYSIASNSNGETSNVLIKIFDILGREILTLVNEKKTPGIYEIQFNGEILSSGIYFYSLETNGHKEVKKMTLLK